MSVYMNYRIIIKNHNNKQLEKDLIKYNNEPIINYDYLYDKILGDNYTSEQLIPITYEIINKEFNIYLEGNHLFLDVEPFFNKFKEDCIIESSSEYDLNYLFGWNTEYYFYKNGKVKSEREEDRFIKNVKKTIKNNGNLYDILIKNAYTNISTLEINKNDDYDSMLIKCLKLSPRLYKCLSYKIRKNKNRNLELLKNNPEIYKYLSDKLKNDKDFILMALQNKVFIKDYPTFLLEDEKIILEAMKYDPFIINRDNVSDTIKNDENVRLKQYKYLLSEEERKEIDNIDFNGLKDFYTTIIDRYNKNYWIIKKISSCLTLDIRNDLDFIKKYVIVCGTSGFGILSDDLRNNNDFMKEIIKYNVDALQYASEELKDDKNLVMESVKKNGRILQYVSSRLKNDKEVVIEAMKNYIGAFDFASDRLKKDEELLKRYNEKHTSIFESFTEVDELPF